MRWICGVLAALLLAGGMPAAAQEEEFDGEAMAQVLEGLFPVEPLTGEEAARLPLASEVVVKVMPPGSYARMMDETLSSFLEPIVGLAAEAGMDAEELALSLGRDVDEVAGLDDAQRQEITALLDPHHTERTRAGMDYMFAQMSEVMTALEPGMRDGLSKAYARRFSADQLNDIAAFFATPTGAFYAAESMLVFTDRQVMRGAMDALPLVMQQMPAMMGGMAEATAHLPPERGFAALSASEQGRVADLLGLSIEDLRESAAWEEEEE